MRQLVLLLSCCSLVMVGCGGGSSSGVVLVESLDQDSGIANPAPSGIGNNVEKASTFTVGITGRLSRIELMVYESLPLAPLIIDVRPTLGGVPVDDDNNVLATINVPIGTLPTTTGVLTSFDLESFDIQVTAGDVLAICMRAAGTTPTGSYTWPTQSADYAGGDGYFRNHSAMIDLWTSTGADATFRTYVKHP